MKQVFIHKGRAIVEDVPTPQINAGEILVHVRASCLSIGTELSGVRSSAVPMWKRALRQPEKVAQILHKVTNRGLYQTWHMIEQKLDASYPIGYSAAGIVVRVGSEIKDIVPGDRVACGGGGYAYHAEFVRVPRNLCVLLPDDLDFENASSVTLGAIALQGVRRARPTLGESFVVLGLGVLGQLTVQLLRANGCRTIGIDLHRERLILAKKLGLDIGLHPGDDFDIEQVARVTDGIGADGVIITAASPSNEVVSTAFKICRKKGRVVLVGDVGLNLNRADFYAKEIDFLISSSYGPGRYDHLYEEQGLDYPVAYIRWTENRNMGEYIRLLAEKKVNVDPLITNRYPINDAAAAYELLDSGSGSTIMCIFTYPCEKDLPRQFLKVQPKTTCTNPGRIGIAILGAGNFARSVHLPNLLRLRDRFSLRAVVARNGHVARDIAKQFHAAYASTDYEVVLADPDVNAVIIATRHHLHSEMALAALRAGKHVLLEKPLALNKKEIDNLDEFVKASGDRPIPVLLTGYNRRFSPHINRLIELLKDRSGPFMINYRMNAGYISPNHWIQGPEGGGRNLGEACHIYDLFTYLTGSVATEISAHSIAPTSHYYERTDNFVATISFADGTVATLTYTSLGSQEYPKEMADVYVDGKLVVMEDYKRLHIYGSRRQSLRTSTQEKGFKEELIAFADAINNGIWPIPWWQQMQASMIALAVEGQIQPKDNSIVTHIEI